MDLSRLAPQLLDLLSEAIIVTDATGRCVAANAAASRLTGYTQAELMGLHLDDLAAVSPHAEVLTICCKDGKERRVEAQVHPLDDYRLYLWRETRAERASPPNESLLRAVFETMTEGVATHQIVYDAAGAPVDYAILDVNPAYTVHTGLVREDVVGRCASEAYLTDEAPYLDIYARVAETGTPEHLEIYVDQTQSHYSISVFSPGPGQFTTVFGNITERKRTEAALRESEERYRRLVETMNEGFGIRDENGICTYANDWLCQMLGYAREEIVGHRLEDFIDAGSLSEFQRQLTRQAEGAETAYEAVWVAKGGRRVPTIISPRVILNEAGDVKGSFAVITDITERKRVEEALERAHEELERRVEARTAELEQERNLLRTLIDALPDFIYIKDTKCRFIQANAGLLRAAGAKTREEIVGKTVFDYAPQTLAEQMHADDMHVLQTGEPIFNREHVYPDPSTGQDGWISVTTVPLRDDRDHPIGLVGITRDITSDKHAEEALQRAHDELEARVEARTADLRRLNAQLQSEIAERRLAEQRVTRLLEQQIAANHLAMALGDSSDSNRIYNTIYEHVCALMDVEAFTVAFFDEDAQLIRADFVIAGGAQLDATAFPPIPLAEEGFGNQSEVIRTGEPLYIPDYREALKRTRTGYTIGEGGNLTDGLPPEEPPDFPRSALLVPMKIEGRTIGVIQVQSRQLDAYSPDDADLLAAMANVAAIAIQNARLFAERMRSEEKLRASEKQYRMIFTHAPLGVIHFDEHGVVLDCNERFAEIVGTPREGILGFDMLARLRDPQMRAALEATLAGELGYYEGDYLSVTSGRLAPVRAFAYAITAEDGRFLGGAALFEDVTERRRRQRELETLLEISHDLSSLLDLDQLLWLLAQRVVALLDADEFTLFRLEGDGETLRPVLTMGEYADQMLAHALKVGEGVTGYSVAHNRPVIANNAHLDPRAVHVTGTPTQEQEHLLVAPLAFRDRITGAILVNRVNKPREYTEEDRDLLAGLAHQAAIAIENARLFEAEREQRVLAEALRDTAAALNSLDLDDVLNRILANIGRVLPHDTASIMLVESGVARVVRCQGYRERGTPDEAVRALEFPVAAVPNMRAMIETGVPCVIPDVLNYPGWVAYPETAWIRANIGAPIRVAGEVIGFLDLNSATPNAFTSTHAERIQTFADQAATAIRNAQIHAQAQHRAALLSTLNKIGQAVTSRLELDAVLEVAYEQVRQVLPLDAFFVCLYDPETETVAFPLLYDEGERYEEAPKPLLRDTLIDHVIESGETALLNRSARELEQAAPTQPVGNTSRVSASLMYAPLKVGAQVIGAISAQSYTLNAYHADHLSLLAGVANQVAVAIENAQLYAQTQQHAAELLMLNEIGRAVSSLLDLDGMLEVIYQQAKRNLPLDVFFVSLYDHESNEVTFPLVYDGGVHYDQPPEQLLPETFIAQVLAASAPLLINRTAEEMAVRAPKYPIGDARPAASMMFAPMQVGARLTGVISAQSYTANAYSGDHLKRLMGVANQVAVAIENARLHAEVQRQNEELEQRVEERTAELRQALAHAQEADRAKSDFVSSVNHELRTPLSNLKLYVRLLRKGHPEKRAFYIDTLDREIDRLSALVEDTLAFASMGRKPPELETINLAEVAQEAANRFTVLADSRQITLNIDSGEAAWVRADADEITRVLVNLLGNAITYTPGGGAVNLHVQSRTVVGGRWAVLTVSDNGPGISPEEQRRIFTPYYRGQAGRESGVPGSGLGLAIVKEIVQLHHGRIELESAPGNGATFNVWFPLV